MCCYDGGQGNKAEGETAKTQSSGCRGENEKGKGFFCGVCRTEACLGVSFHKKVIQCRQVREDKNDFRIYPGNQDTHKERAT